MKHRAENHRSDRIGWLRAAVLGANDGIVSTASLVLGVAAAGADHRTLLLTSVSGLIAGAMSMAAGEFVSVHSQADTENADLARERAELKSDPAGEQRELAGIYVGRGLDRPLADQVAKQLMAHDAIGAHARDELGFLSYHRCATDPGCAGLGGQLFSRRSAADWRRAGGGAYEPDHLGLGHFTGVPGWVGRSIGAGRRREHGQGCLARRVLGCHCDGCHRRCGGIVRGGGLSAHAGILCTF